MSGKATDKPISTAEKWFEQNGWQPFNFQRETWAQYLAGNSGLVNAPTGSGKTYSLWLGCLLAYQQNVAAHTGGLQVLWITPLRALTSDIHKAMEKAAEGMAVPWRIEMRTGDTTSAQRQKQKRKMPECLLTTPESLHLLLAQKGYPNVFKNLKAIVVDEWHELMGTKRGIQVELGISRLRAMVPHLQIWGISATIGNMAEAAQVLIPKRPGQGGKAPIIIRSDRKKEVMVEALLPEKIEKFPWAGHLGIKMIDQLLPIIRESRSTLLFINTRAQTEIWYQQLLEKAPELAGQMAMHHGSLDRETRTWVEGALHEGRLKLVVCTSSLDLGVDFHPVETVVQVGSPKGISRFLQRAGRSGHRPGAKSKIYFLPTHALELIEAAALRQATHEVSQNGNEQFLESRRSLKKPFDVLVQYLVTLAVSDGFYPDEVLEEIRMTSTYANLSYDDWDWCLRFITTGGESLSAYGEYNKVEVEGGLYKVVSRKTAMRHRLSMGTIVSEPLVKVKFTSGQYIGTVEEYFISSLKVGDVFWFAGRSLAFVRLKEMTAQVKKSNKKRGIVPRWLGGRLPLSSELAQLMREKLQSYPQEADVELQAIAPILDLQAKWSAIPKKDELLIESVETSEGYHCFCYPFAGRQVHEIMAALIAYRISQMQPISFSMAMNDYGFELLSDVPIPLAHALELDLFTTHDLMFDVEQSLNNSEMAKRRFREIASIAGLVFKGYPGKSVATKHLQASSQLLFDVFVQYDPGNLLIEQAYREVMDVQLEEQRLIATLEAIKHQKIVLKYPPRPSPFAFPIMVDRLRDQISSETLEDRVAKMQLRLEAYAEDGE